MRAPFELFGFWKGCHVGAFADSAMSLSRWATRETNKATDASKGTDAVYRRRHKKFHLGLKRVLGLGVDARKDKETELFTELMHLSAQGQTSGSRIFNSVTGEEARVMEEQQRAFLEQSGRVAKPVTAPEMVDAIEIDETSPERAPYHE